MTTELIAPPEVAPVTEPPESPEPCQCGQPIPPGRVAYCSWRCRFEDDLDFYDYPDDDEDAA